MPLTSTFIPSTADVECYKRLRGLARDLNSRIVKTIPREAIQQLAIAPVPAAAGGDIKGVAGQESDRVKRNSHSLAESTRCVFAFQEIHAPGGVCAAYVYLLREGHLKAKEC